MVLIILAGVAINLTLGDSGIFNKAKYAKEEYLNASRKEEIELADVEDKIDEYIETTRDTVKKGETILWEGTGDTTHTPYYFKESTYDVDNYDRIIIEFSQVVDKKQSTSLSKGFYKKNQSSDIRLLGILERHTDLHFINNGFEIDEIVGEDSDCYQIINRIIGVKY